MGFFDRFRQRSSIDAGSPSRAVEISVGSENSSDAISTFNNRNITFRSSLTNICYDDI